MAAVSRGLLQPCDTTSRVQQDTYIPFGLAFWPGGVLENWTDINPCDVQTRDQLTQAGVKLAVYNMKAERTTWLNMTREDRISLLQGIEGMPKVASVVAFQGAVVSPPRYFASDDAAATGGTGYASNLLLQFNYKGGELSWLQWHGSTCSGCAADRCLGGNTCAVSGQNDGDTEEPVMMAGCVGTDRHSAPFISGDPSLDIR